MKMPGKLPPLNLLRAFEAVARLGSVSAAANELYVTHSAVSQQIKALEESLGVKLLNRVVGAAYPDGCRAGARGRGQRSVVRPRADGESGAPTRQSNRLTITTLPSFAACWLTPRISRFLEQAPEAQINIVPTSNLLRLRPQRDRRFFGIRFGLRGDGGGWLPNG